MTPPSNPAVFVLEALHRDDTTIVADGVAFPPPNECVVVNWHNDGGTVILDSIDELYETMGRSPRVLWRHGANEYSEAEPEAVVTAH